MGGLAGSILAIYGLVKTFKDDAEGFSWLILVGIGIWLYLLWRLFQVRKTTAYSLFIVSILAGVIGWVGWQSQVKATEDKVVVLVAKFDGPEETYGLRDQIMEELHNTVKDNDDAVIVEGKEVITAAQGSNYARRLGEKEKADLVIWAWYRPTEDPNITIHIENLSTDQIETLEESEIYQPQATLAELKSFEIQRRLGSETSTLISFITGLISFESGDYQTSLDRFEKVLLEKDISTFINPGDLYFSIGYSYGKLTQPERSIEAYDKAINEDPKLGIAYFNRAYQHWVLGQPTQAIQDYDKAIQLKPDYPESFINRGNVYLNIGQYEQAIENYDKAIQLEPNSPTAYVDRGIAYRNLGQNERAIQDYDKAIQLDPNYSPVYINRGVAYMNLEKYKQALQDYDKAIQLDPNYPTAYSNRGNAYFKLKQYERAIEEFDKALLLDPNYADAYYNRGGVYLVLGKTSESEADFKKYEELTGQKP